MHVWLILFACFGNVCLIWNLPGCRSIELIIEHKGEMVKFAVRNFNMEASSDVFWVVKSTNAIRCQIIFLDAVQASALNLRIIILFCRDLHFPRMRSRTSVSKQRSAAPTGLVKEDPLNE